MTINLPNRLEIDINNIPENFEELVTKSFAEYTEGTSKDFRDEDRLSYIDLCRKYIYGIRYVDFTAEVKNCIKSSFNYEIEENCEIIERESFFTFDFMEVCFSSGYNLADKPLCIKKEDVNHHVNKALNKLMCRIIKTVMNYQN